MWRLPPGGDAPPAYGHVGTPPRQGVTLTFGGAFRNPAEVPVEAPAGEGDEEVIDVDDEDDEAVSIVSSESCASSSSSFRSAPSRRTARSSRAKRARNRYDVESTICSSGFSDVLFPTGGGPEIEKVLAVRRKGGNDEYLIKLKKRSYAKVRWWSKDEAVSTLDAKKLHAQSTKYLERHRVPAMIDHEPDHQLFPVDYTLMDRVVTVNTERTKALVLWRQLNYANCTWEPITEVPKQLLDRYAKFQKRQMVQPAETPTLRGYQQEGVAWMLERFRKKEGGILADEMGLGKTVQVLMFLNDVFASGEAAAAALVVVPLQVLQHWRDELTKWGVMNAVCYQGPREDRQTCAEHEVFRLRKGRQAGGKKRYDVLPHVVVTTYETIIAPESGGPLRLQRWDIAVFDEAHKLKNSKTNAWDVARSIHAPSKYLLTGTPVQNNTEELWALLHIASPNIFPAKKADKDAFVTALEGRTGLMASVASLKAKIAPYLLRREKGDVLAGELPDRADVHINVPLTSVQKQLYAAVLQRNKDILMGQQSGRLGSIVMQLRHVSNHPFLIEGQADWVEAHMPKDPPPELPSFIACSAKLTILDKLLRKWRAEKRKVLIFSQFKIVLNLIQTMLDFRGWQYARLDGQVNKQERDRDMARFKRNPDCFVFLLTTRAGGVGLNLVMANRVVIYDSDWNPQMDLQAAARSHRIGQKNEVKIYRLIAQGTLEERMVQTASRKLALSTTLLQTSGDGGGPATDTDLRDYLRHGAYEMMRAAKAQPEEERLLQSSADAILEEAEQTATHSQPEGARNRVGDIANFSEITLADTGVSAEQEDAFWTKLFAASTLGQPARASPPPPLPSVSPEPPAPVLPIPGAAAPPPSQSRPSPTLSLSFGGFKRRTPPPSEAGGAPEHPEKRIKRAPAPAAAAGTLHQQSAQQTAPAPETRLPKPVAVSPAPMLPRQTAGAPPPTGASPPPRPGLHLSFGTRKRSQQQPDGDAGEKKLKREEPPGAPAKAAPTVHLTFGRRKPPQ